MQCREVEEMMPLYVEGDLREAKMQAVAAHLQRCADCNRLFDEYGDSQRWLQSYTLPPFDDRFYADLQQRVMREVRKGSARPLFFEWLRGSWLLKPALALAAVVLLVGALAVLVVLTDREPTAAQRAGREPVTPPQREESPASAPAPTAPTEPEVREPQRQLATTAPRPRRAAPRVSVAPVTPPMTPVTTVTPEEVAGIFAATLIEPVIDDWFKPPFAEPQGWHESALFASQFVENDLPTPKTLRIELQTSDPRIRIIWFAPKLEKSENRNLDTE